jgi:hypothetical protein
MVRFLVVWCAVPVRSLRRPHGMRSLTSCVRVCVCLLLQDLVQSCLHGGCVFITAGPSTKLFIWEDMCYETRQAEACVD